MKLGYKRGLCIFGLLSITTFSYPAFAEPTPEAKAYLNQAVELIRLNHRSSKQGDWPILIAEAQSDIADAKAPKDTYSAIRRVLAKLDEPHSFLREPFAAAQNNGDTTSPENATTVGPSLPSWQLEKRRFGFLTLPALDTFGHGGEQRGSEYTSTVRNGLMTMDKAKICGWIIDLRQNEGGNMWPMLRGLDPLLGPSPFGAFILPDGSKHNWVRAFDDILPTAEKLAETPPSFKLKHANAAVAVLVGPRTGSSGEMAAIALIGRENVRVFGKPTANFTSANKVYPLSDGALLVLTETSVSNRLGHEYTGPIVPDEQLSDDQAKPTAMKWLKKKC
jgi:carboxyl-terminal processing protease